MWVHDSERPPRLERLSGHVRRALGCCARHLQIWHGVEALINTPEGVARAPEVGQTVIVIVLANCAG